MKPMVSVGVPVYNGSKYLREALDSIQSQTYENFEVIISDNASTDETPDICMAYVKYDNRFKYFALKKNMGAAYNYNHAFRLSTGKYFKWAADDDLLNKNFLSNCVDILEKNSDVVLCSCQAIIIDKFGKRRQIEGDDLNLSISDITSRFEKTLYPMNFCHCGIFGLIRRDILSKTRLIGNYLASDRVLISQLSLHGPIYEIEKELFYRRKHERNIGISPEDLKFYDPQLKPIFLLPEFRVLYEQLKNVYSSNLKTSVKRTLYLKIFHCAHIKRKSFKLQLKNALRMILRRIN